jgi:hypothetical protein
LVRVTRPTQCSKSSYFTRHWQSGISTTGGALLLAIGNREYQQQVAHMYNVFLPLHDNGNGIVFKVLFR